MDASLDTPAIERAKRGFIFARALRATLGRPSTWLFIWGVTAVLAIIPAAAHYGWLRAAIANRYEPGRLAYILDGSLDRDHPETSFRTDFAKDIALLDESTAGIGAALAFLTLLFGVFSAGGWLQIVLGRTQGHALRRFLFGGARYFWRFFRLLLLTLLVLGLFGWALHEYPWKEYVLHRQLEVPRFDFERLETLESEWTYVRITWLQALIYGLLFGLTLTWGDYTRTRLALHDTRSVLGAGLRTFFTMLRHPVRTLRPMILLLLVELIVIIAGASLLDAIEHGLQTSATLGRVLVLLGIGQLLFLWRVITRGARYHAAVAVSSEIVRPLSRPDPWKSSIGGPGGPRYPLEGSDEYGVSL